MDQDVIATHLENLDRRLAKVEQILPTLATKDELRTLATKEELRAATAPLATREELQDAVAPLATKEELRREIREEGETSRRYMKVLIEHQDTKIELLAEHVLSLTSKRTEE